MSSRPVVICLALCLFLSACSQGSSRSSAAPTASPGAVISPSPTPTPPPQPAAPSSVSVPVFSPQNSSWQSDSLGHTLIDSFQNAPYPHSSRSFTDDRVMIFVPKDYRISDEVHVLLHFHGHRGEIVETDAKHKYRQQLVLSSRNAVLVIPQGPLRASDSGIGKLEDSQGLKRLMDEVLARLKGEGVAGPAATIQNLVISGHSGGYFAISRCLSRGGMDSVIREVYLHDALYGQSTIFETWAAQSGRKLISTYQGFGSTRTNNLALQSALQGRGVSVLSSLSDQDLRSSSSVIAALDHSHGNIVRARFVFAEMLQHSSLKGLGAPTPEIRTVQENNGLVTISWSPINSDQARGLRLYQSSDGQSFQLLASEQNLSPQSDEFTVGPVSGQRFFYLVAVDENGSEGPRSNVYGWAPSPRRVLIVDGFHRSQGSSLQGRVHDLAVLHGTAISQSGFGFETCSAKAVTDGVVLLTRYDNVDWFAGDQSDLDQSLTTEEQNALKSFLAAGGSLLISGSELAYDLSKGRSGDRAFLRDTLKASYGGDKSGSQSLSGLQGYAGVGLGIGGATAAYPEDFPDYVAPVGGSQVILRYGNQRNGGVRFKGSFSGSSEQSALVFLSFPFETIDTGAQRDRLMGAILAEFESLHLQAGR